MKYSIFYIVFFLTSIASCETKEKKPSVSSYSDNCLWVNHDKELLTKLFKNEYAQSVSDSFIYSLYLNNYKTKIRKENTAKDSVSIFELRIVPKLVVTPRGDSDVYDIAYAFTDINCSKYYDSILKSQEPIIYGLRFSLSERKVICYLSSDRKLLIDSSFMNIHKKTKQPDFIKVVEKNIPTITDEKLKTFLKHLLSTQ